MIAKRINGTSVREVYRIGLDKTSGLAKVIVRVSTRTREVEYAIAHICLEL